MVHSSVCSENATLDALSERGLDARTVARHRGPLGRLLRSRAPMLRARGLLGDGDHEEIVIVRARRV